MYERLDKDDAARPAVQEVEALIWNAGKHTENRVATTEGDSQRSQSECKGTNAIGKAANAASGVVKVCAFDRCNPSFVSDTGKSFESQSYCICHWKLDSRESC
jgi:hypothetical protein